MKSSVLSTLAARVAIESALEYVRNGSDYYAFCASRRMGRLPAGAIRTDTAGMCVFIYDKMQVLRAFESQKALSACIIEENTVKLSHMRVDELTKAFGRPICVYDIPADIMRKWAELEKAANNTQARTFEKLVVSLLNDNYFSFASWKWIGGLSHVQTDAINERGERLEVKGKKGRFTRFVQELAEL